MQQRSPVSPAVIGTRTLLWGGGDLAINSNASDPAGLVEVQVSDQYGWDSLRGIVSLLKPSPK